MSPWYINVRLDQNLELLPYQKSWEVGDLVSNPRYHLSGSSLCLLQLLLHHEAVWPV